jgi:hypothetical protein
MRRPGLGPATMGIFENQTFNEEGSIVRLPAYFDVHGLLRRRGAPQPARTAYGLAILLKAGSS